VNVIRNTLKLKKLAGILSICILAVNLYGSKQIILKGSWFLKTYEQNTPNEPYEVLNLNLQIDENHQVIGEFEYFYKWYSKVEDLKSFTSSLSDDVFIFNFDSNFEGKNGKIKITVNKDCSLNWKLIQEPNGEFYVPYEAHLLINKLYINKLCNNLTKYILSDKQPLYSSPNINSKTKMYLIKGDKVEILEEKDNWLYILYKGKKEIKAWIPKDAIKATE
jgi:hypothetical protein